MFLNKIFILLSLLSCLAPLQGTTFRAIITADTSSNLTVPTRKDLHILNNTLKEICSQTGLQLSYDILTGPLLRHPNVHSLLTSPKNVDADVLLFYYTGHGFHASQITSPWPSIFLTVSHECLDPDRICKQLLSYKARLTIVLFDCCNSNLEQEFSLKGIKKALSGKKKETNLRKLFLNCSGTIIATASLPGNPAYAFNEGSLFSLEFFNNIFYSETWESLFAKVTQNCTRYQTPFVSLELSQNEGEPQRHSNKT